MKIGHKILDFLLFMYAKWLHSKKIFLSQHAFSLSK